MLKHPKLTLDRIQLFALRELATRQYTEHVPVQLEVFHAPGRIRYEEAMQGTYRPTLVGERFGPFWSSHWFRVEIEIPTSWQGGEVHLLWDSSSEATVWEDGQPLQGLTGSGVGWGPPGPVRPEFILTRSAEGGQSRVLYVEIAINNLFGTGVTPDPQVLDQIGLLRQAEIALFDRDAWDLLWDFQVIGEMAAQLPPNTPRGGQALFTANEMINQIDLEDRATWPAARALARDFFSARNGEGQLNLSAIGHAHIDTAWLWPLAETRRKCTRTFSTAVRYMEDYPNYKFACSQAQQLAWMKEMHPDLYQRIRDKVQSGQFIPVGGSWVEPDCNLPSGESLVRQFLYGQRFFEQEFGRTCEEFWEPDVFGYSAALPQILRQAGIRYFLTIKLSWNQFNKLDSHTFWWEGLDGSRVLTHFPPADTYNAFAKVEEVLYSVQNYKDIDRSKEAYFLFGYGDGGGGPTREMLERIERMKDVDGMPRVEMRSAQDFFTRLEQNSKQLTTWVGELYFELHRGTYTTQAHTKKYNRQCEFLLHDVEYLAAVAHACHGHDYPGTEIERLWKIVLTNQFHDIIPGSSINLVYQDASVHYGEVLSSGAGLRNQALAALYGHPQQDDSPGVLMVNTSGVDRTEVIELPPGVETAQTSAEGLPLGIASLPAYGYRVEKPTQAVPKTVRVTEQGEQILLENEFVRVVFNRQGALLSLYDLRQGREGIEAGQAGNRFVMFDDRPNAWDAWDVDIFHLEKSRPAAGAERCQVIETGPLRAAVRFDYALSANSTLSQVVQLSAISPRLDFITDVEWHERQTFLKVEFPIAVRAMYATYEVQFGHLQRPTHFNTSWDWARFEVLAHKWADLSDAVFGVALLNDCKYGYAVHGSIMRLSLLRGPTSPDPEADQGHHTFRYALLPHAGPVQTSGVIEEGYRFNMPLLVAPSAAPPDSGTYFTVDDPALLLDTVKKAEDGREVIVRLYETRGTQGTARFTTSLPVQSIRRCNLLETDGDGSEQDSGDSLLIHYHPFELISLKLRLA